MSELVPRQKCIVKGCDNHSNHGEFVGNICKPCYVMLTTGKCSPVGNTFIHAMRSSLMRFDDFINELYLAGWRPVGDAQHASIRKVWIKLFPVIAALEDELELSLKHEESNNREII